jgi:hypothetical protein
MIDGGKFGFVIAQKAYIINPKNSYNLSIFIGIRPIIFLLFFQAVNSVSLNIYNKLKTDYYLY